MERNKRAKCEKMAKHYVYILQCKDQTLYTGYTNNLERRLQMHEKGKGAKYTRGRGPFIIVYVEEYEEKERAMQREAQIKKLSRKEKIELVRNQQAEAFN